MKYLLSMDGGGTKTAWILTSAAGNVAASYHCPGCSHPQLGIDNTLALIHSGIDTLLSMAGCLKEDILAASFGLPCYGEYPDADRIICRDLREYLFPASVTVCNDVELGFAGGLLLEDGLHLVAGTGAIVVGRNGAGATARANGWHPCFSDEGSGFWLGMQALSLFAKEADGRAPRSALYSILRQELALERDEDIIPYYDSNLSGDRKKTASLQLLLKKTALAGDMGAIQLYEAAARELYLSLCGAYHALSFSPRNHIRISYSGGLFSEGNFILPTLTRLTARLSAQLIPPHLPPVYGGILLAMQSVSKREALNLCPLLKNQVYKEAHNENHST